VTGALGRELEPTEPGAGRAHGRPELLGSRGPEDPAGRGGREGFAHRARRLLGHDDETHGRGRAEAGRGPAHRVEVGDAPDDPEVPLEQVLEGVPQESLLLCDEDASQARYPNPASRSPGGRACRRSSVS
jgi:hypothetical protein